MKPVIDRGHVAEVLTRADLLTALAQRDQEVAVREVMQREFQMVDSSDMLERAMQRLQEYACHTLPVQHAGRVVGLLTMDNVGEFVAIQAALSGACSGRPRAASSGRRRTKNGVACAVAWTFTTRFTGRQEVRP